MNNLTKSKIIKWAKKSNIEIVIDHPQAWGIPCKAKRAYSFAIKNNMGLWEEPKDIQCYSLKTLLSDITHLAWSRLKNK